jgi:L-threonylcarbamoyladenylate synthase
MLRLPVSPRALNARLRAGGLIAYPTRASFGLGCLPNQAHALHRLTRLKRRPIHKGMIVVADKQTRVQALMGHISAEQQQTLSTQWPGNWTWLVPASHKVLPALRGKNRSIALRVDSFETIKALCQTLKTALVSTSANRSGHKPIRTAREVHKQFGQSVTVIFGRCQKRARASTIADLISLKILRE